MGTVVPINLIEIVGTVFTVEGIVSMHLRNEVPIEELVEDYGLSRAGIHAALAYYYTHQEEIDASIRFSEKLIEENSTPPAIPHRKSTAAAQRKEGLIREVGPFF